MVLHRPVEPAGVIANWEFPIPTFREDDFSGLGHSSGLNLGATALRCPVLK